MSWLKAKDWATGVEYSSLFHSGLRAISRRPCARRARTYSSSSPSREKSSSGGTSSIAPLSSRLLKRSTTRTRHPSPPMTISTDSSPTTPPRRLPKVTRPRPSSMFVRPTTEMADAWSSGGGFFEIGEYPKFPEEEIRRVGYLMPPIEIDTVRSLAGSRSFFVNLGEMDLPPTGEESFLLLSSDPDGFLQHPIPRRERPTTPLPVSCQSSLHHHTRETRRERGDCAWMLEESSPERKAYELEGEDGETGLDNVNERSDVADWRQFHVDWLQTIR